MSDNQDQKLHPWRHCPIGKHGVKEHLRHNPPSKKNPQGTISGLTQKHCHPGRRAGIF